MRWAVSTFVVHEGAARLTDALNIASHLLNNCVHQKLLDFTALLHRSYLLLGRSDLLLIMCLVIGVVGVFGCLESYIALLFQLLDLLFQLLESSFRLLELIFLEVDINHFLTIGDGLLLELGLERSSRRLLAGTVAVVRRRLR